MKKINLLYDSLRLSLRVCLALLLITRCFANLRHGYSMLKYGHKLDRRMITSYDKFSILDCVEDCLRTTRCRSVNYHQGAHFCQTNFENKTTVHDLYIEKPDWIYSDIEDWDKTIAGACSMSNCSMNEKCIRKTFGQFTCALSGNLGCFENNRTALVLEVSKILNINGEQECESYCLKRNIRKYFGLQYGKYCYCGMDIKNSPKRMPDEECSTPCRGNDKEFCGGDWRIAIFTSA